MNPLPILFGAALLLSSTAFVHASGSYTSRPPTPPSQSQKVDRTQYNLGQKVFNGKTKPTTADATAQRPRLEALQAQLPASVAAKKNLPTLAGTLSDDQLAALEYYVRERYPVK
jgi:cytochrome c553